MLLYSCLEYNVLYRFLGKFYILDWRGYFETNY